MLRAFAARATYYDSGSREDPSQLTRPLGRERTRVERTRVLEVIPSCLDRAATARCWDRAATVAVARPEL